MSQEVAQVEATLLGNEPAGEYRHLVFDAPAVAAAARPGQFVALAIGGHISAMLLRRSFSIHRVEPVAGMVQIVVANAGPGTDWITSLQPGAVVDLVGPLGQPFPLPPEGTQAVLVGGGYGSAPMFWLADSLREKGIAVTHVLGAATAGRLFGAELVSEPDALVVTTDDGSAGLRGRVTTALPSLLQGSGTATVYACGPMPMLRAVTELADEQGATAFVAVEEAMACGIGVCMTCVLPVIGRDGLTRMSRSCVDGPIFEGTRVRWDAIADGRVAVPDDCLGSPVGGSGR